MTAETRAADAETRAAEADARAADAAAWARAAEVRAVQAGAGAAAAQARADDAAAAAADLAARYAAAEHQARAHAARAARLERERAALADRLAEQAEADLELARRAAAAEAELARVRDDRATWRDRARAAERAQPAAAAPPAEAFAAPDEQFRHEVYLAWAVRIPAPDKAARPLPPYALGPRFLQSLQEAQGVDRGKVVDVVVEVLTGLADTAPGRELHQLRTGAAGSPPVVDAAGRTCWRAALQRSTASARRLHFWRGPDGVELSRVVLHDDTDP